MLLQFGDSKLSFSTGEVLYVNPVEMVIPHIKKFRPAATSGQEIGMVKTSSECYSSP
jgi:hypothetical protein